MADAGRSWDAATPRPGRRAIGAIVVKSSIAAQPARILVLGLLAATVAVIAGTARIATLTVPEPGSRDVDALRGRADAAVIAGAAGAAGAPSTFGAEARSWCATHAGTDVRRVESGKVIRVLSTPGAAGARE